MTTIYAPTAFQANDPRAGILPETWIDPVPPPSDTVLRFFHQHVGGVALVGHLDALVGIIDGRLAVLADNYAASTWPDSGERVGGFADAAVPLLLRRAEYLDRRRRLAAMALTVGVDELAEDPTPTVAECFVSLGMRRDGFAADLAVLLERLAARLASKLSEHEARSGPHYACAAANTAHPTSPMFDYGIADAGGMIETRERLSAALRRIDSASGEQAARRGEKTRQAFDAAGGIDAVAGILRGVRTVSGTLPTDPKLAGAVREAKGQRDYVAGLIDSLKDDADSKPLLKDLATQLKAAEKVVLQAQAGASDFATEQLRLLVGRAAAGDAAAWHEVNRDIQGTPAAFPAGLPAAVASAADYALLPVAELLVDTYKEIN